MLKILSISKQIPGYKPTNADAANPFASLRRGILSGGVPADSRFPYHKTAPRPGIESKSLGIDFFSRLRRAQPSTNIPPNPSIAALAGLGFACPKIIAAVS